MTFPWARYWVPLNSRICMGSGWDDTPGFLADPEDGFLGKHENAHLLPTVKLLAVEPGCLVLCGEPGMGKSQTLRSHYETRDGAQLLRIEFRDVPDSGRFERLTVQSPGWSTWRNGTEMLTLVIDGVDEGLIKIAGFVDFLTGLLRPEPIERLQVVLACRSLEWPHSEGQRLIASWGEKSRCGVFELCPLRDRDARIAAEAVLKTSARRSVNVFMRAVRQHQLVGLATRPLTLKMLLHEYRSGGKFSRSHRELYRKFSHYLCLDPDDARRNRLKHQSSPRIHVPPATRQRVAGRIAALMLVCGRSAILPGATDKASGSDLTFDEICASDDRVGGTDFNVTPTIVESVLESALFWPRENGRVGFYHQTFAESLAAEYLRDLPFPQKRSLLCRRDRHGEFVHPPLVELAAWMAADSEEFLNHLLVHDPETLLRSDVSAIKETSKAALVEAVLRKAGQEQLFDVRGLERFFHTLNHPGLATQLRTVIRDQQQNYVVRRIAFAIAEACEVTDLLDDALARIADDKDGRVHSVAASAVTDLMDAAAAPKVEWFLTAKRQQPLEPGVQLSLLHALLNHGWTLTQALPYVEGALRQRDMSGHILAQHAQPADAEALLRACLRWPGCFDRLSRYHAFVRQAHDLGLARIGEPMIRRLMAQAWALARKRYQHDSFVSDGEGNKGPNLVKRLREDATLRHKFIDDLISLPPGGDDEYWWRIQELTLTEDFPHFLARAQIGSTRRRQAYAQLAARTYNFETHASLWDGLIAAIERFPEMKEAFAWLRTWEIGAADSKKQKENHYQSIRWQQQAEKRHSKKPQPDPIKIWDRDVKELDAKEPEFWLHLAYRLYYRGDRERMDDEEKVDVRTSPGWKHHDEAARAKIVAGARRFVLDVPGNPQHPAGGNSDFDSLAYKALYLLKDEIEDSAQLADAVRRNWLPIIYDEFSNADDHHLEMVALAYRLDGAALRTLLKERVLRHTDRNDGYTYALREFARCWDQALADFVVEFTVKEVTKPATVGCIEDFLAEHDLPAALALWRRLRAEPAATDRFIAASASLASWRLFEVWCDVWPTLRDNPDVARQVFLGFDRSEQKKFLERVDSSVERRLADLYLYLRELFPPADDPPTPTGSYTPTRRMEIARLRNEFPALLAGLGTDAAADELLRIANALPAGERIWMRWRWREAVVAQRRKTWHPPGPEVVLALVRQATSRLLSDENDLLALVMESLERLNDNLTNQSNSWRRNFWKPERKGRNGARYYSPHDEVEMSRLITTWLQSDLAPGRGITIQREVQVQWDKRTDTEVRAVAVKSADARPLEIVVETKGCWHPKVRTAHQDQLVDDYLLRSGKTHGIYLVVWTNCKKWNDPKDTRKVRLKAKTFAAAREELTELVSVHDGTKTPAVVRSVVLDARI